MYDLVMAMPNGPVPDLGELVGVEIEIRIGDNSTSGRITGAGEFDRPGGGTWVGLTLAALVVTE